VANNLGKMIALVLRNPILQALVISYVAVFYFGVFSPCLCRVFSPCFLTEESRLWGRGLSKKLEVAVVFCLFAGDSGCLFVGDSGCLFWIVGRGWFAN